MTGQAACRFLLVSNGYGEDAVAAHIARALMETCGAETAGFPTVGRGRFYAEKKVPLAGTGLQLPSEGFVRTPRDLFGDLAHNLAGKSLTMGRALGKASAQFDFLIAVGDPWLLFFTSLFTPLPVQRRIFVGVQQSEWYGSRKPFKQHYSRLERGWMKRRAGLIYVRDYKTRDYLLGGGMRQVRCTGNPMMDCFTLHPSCPLPSNNLIGILPGSKQEAYRNLGTAFKVAAELYKRMPDLLFAVALSPHLDIGEVRRRYGLRIEEQVSDTDNDGCGYARCVLPPDKVPVIISGTLFGDIITRSDAVIGLSGTGNEQAAGCGKPVFAFWGEGPQITRKFMEAQKKLLGPSLFLFPPSPEEIAREMDRVLKDDAALQAAAENGTLRMSGRGSIRKMAGEIERYAHETVCSGHGQV